MKNVKEWLNLLYCGPPIPKSVRHKKYIVSDDGRLSGERKNKTEYCKNR